MILDKSVIIKLQMALNSRMYKIGAISYDMYYKTNEILISRIHERH